MTSITIPEQRAFIHGRDIRHNIILAESLLYRKPQPNGALISLDWAKAYDRVDYRYLLDVINSYGFPGGLISKLLATMIGFELQIATPDGNQPFFPRERGVGQGCPCAPLLFALAIDPVARLIKNKVEGIPVSKYVDVKAKIALCADDTMIFTASQLDINNAEEALQAYMNASGALLNWNKSIAIPMGRWKYDPHIFRCPTLEADKRVRYLGIYLGQTRPENPWEAKIPKMTKRLDIWKSMGLSMLARANICMTLIASCARYHASCATASPAQIKDFQKAIRNFLWSGDRKKRGYCRTKLPIASLPRRWGGLGVPNIQAIIDAHHLRMWAVAMTSDEDWAWALRSDAEDVLRASNLSHPLCRLSTRLKVKNNSLAAIIIQTLRKRIRSRMYLRPDDLLLFPNDFVEAILHEYPFLAKPENMDDGLPVIREFSPSTAGQQASRKKPFPDTDLKFASRNSGSRPFNTTVHDTQGRILATSHSTKGSITTSKTPVSESEDPNDKGDATPLAVRYLRSPPATPRLYSFGNLPYKWSWVLLPSPYERYPFPNTSVRTFTAAFTISEAFPRKPDKPLWKSEAWRIARSIPNDAAVTFMWKYLNHVLLSKKTLDDNSVCRFCQGNTSLNHILFNCPASKDLWKKFDEEHNLTIPPSQRLLNRCSWRIAGHKKAPSILAQLEFLHLYHVWSTWWSLQRSPDDVSVIHPHSWLRRVITCYLCLNDKTEWTDSPYLQKCLSEWKKLHKVHDMKF